MLARSIFPILPWPCLRTAVSSCLPPAHIYPARQCQCHNKCCYLILLPFLFSPVTQFPCVWRAKQFRKDTGTHCWCCCCYCKIDQSHLAFPKSHLKFPTVKDIRQKDKPPGHAARRSGPGGTFYTTLPFNSKKKKKQAGDW